MSRIMNDEEIKIAVQGYKLEQEYIYTLEDLANIIESLIYRAVEAQRDFSDSETRKEIGKWLDRNILSTDNRVTQLYVLPKLRDSLLIGEMPE